MHQLLSAPILIDDSQFYFMDNPKTERKAYVQHPNARQIHLIKRSSETNQTLNDSLPFIQQNKSLEKANVVHNELNDTKSQIILMQAKLRKLKNIKQKNEMKNQKNMNKIQFMNLVRQRNLNAFEYKQKIREQKEEELERLKYQASSMREFLLSERVMAQNSLYTLKANEAEEERKRHKQHQYLINRLKELDAFEKAKKAEKVKEFHEVSSSRLKDFQDSRVNLSRDNYKKKVESAKKDKERARSLLGKLKEQQQKILNQVKVSEQALLSSLYSLETLNPQRNRKKFNSLDKSSKYDIDTYSNEEFQS